jgi:hypothetical protein
MDNGKRRRIFLVWELDIVKGSLPLSESGLSSRFRLNTAIKKKGFEI